MTTETQLLIKANDRGFFNAATIKSSHLLGTTILNIPEEAKIIFDEHGNLVFSVNGNKYFYDQDGKMHTGLIYHKRLDRWSEVVTTRETDLTGRYLKVLKLYLGGNKDNYSQGSYLKILSKSASDVCYEVEHVGVLQLTGKDNRIDGGYVELMPVGWTPEYSPAQYSEFKGLSEFPEEGVCWQPNDALYSYLERGRRRSSSMTEKRRSDYKGLAWCRDSFYGVLVQSNKKEYHISQLEPFFPGASPTKASVKHYGINGVEILPGDYVVVEFPGNDSHGIEGFVEKIFSESDGLVKVQFQRPLPPMPGGGELFAVPLSRVLLIQDSFPKKWCIKSHPLNYEMIDGFMRNNAHKWRAYTKTWTTEGNHNYFHYPPVNNTPCHSYSKPQPGYTEITTEQFKKYVLTHTDREKIVIDNLNKKEDGKRHIKTSIKVQRSHIQIRQGNPIRAVGIRCTSSKVRIRS